MVLFIASGLFLRSFVELRRVDLGFRTEDLHAGLIHLAEMRYPEAGDKRSVFADLRRRLEAVPGVGEAAFTSALPLYPARLQRSAGMVRLCSPEVVLFWIEFSDRDLGSTAVLRRGQTATAARPSVAPGGSCRRRRLRACLASSTRDS